MDLGGYRSAQPETGLVSADRTRGAMRIDGRAIARALDARTAADVAAIVAGDGIAPGLAVVLVG